MLTTIPRTAAFSWGPGRQLVTGSENALEIWDLLDYETKAQGTTSTTKPAKPKSSGADFFDEPENDDEDAALVVEEPAVEDDGPGPKPKAIVKETARFLNVAWGSSNVIAGGMEGGELKMWDLNKILSNEGSNALLATHSRPVRGLQFGPIQSHLLATGGGAGEVYIWDVNTPDGAPYAPTTGKADADAVKWNRVVAHVLGGVGHSGAVVWDLRGKREVVRLPGGRMSDLEWSPDNATKLATACEDDQTPVVQLWDLRHARAPEQVYSHHTLGVRSLSWSIHDPSFLLSSGKEGRAVCFSSSTGDVLGEVIGQGTISWSPSQPGIAAFAGDSSVRILPAQNLERDNQEVGGGEDFFDVARGEGEGLGLTTAGKWLGSRGGVTWGFGGRLVSWGQDGNKVKVRRVVWEGEKVERAQKLVNAIKKGDAEGGLKDLGILGELFEGDVTARVAKLLGTDQVQEEESEDKEVEEEDDFFTQTHVESEPYKIDSSDAVTSALVKGNIPAAVKACVKEGRWTEALLLATKGPAELLDETEKKYFARESAPSTSSESLVKAVVRGEISDVVKRGEGWREVLSVVSRFAASSEPKEETFPALVDQMGERWAEEELWILGGRLEKLVDVWGSGENGLDGLMERVAVFRGATGFVDPDLARTKASTKEEGEETRPLKWRLAKLYEKYLEYIDILVGQGKEEEARVFLEFVPAGYEGAEAIRERLGIKKPSVNVAAAVATSKPAVKSAYTPASAPTFAPVAPASGFAPASSFAPPAPQLGYTPSGSQQFPNSASGRSYPPVPNTSAPSQYQQAGPYGNNQFGYQNPNAGPPPVSAPPPPPPRRDNTGWNDAPPQKNAPPPKLKSSTPKPITSPFAGGPSPYEIPRPGSRGITSPPPPMGPPRGLVSPPPQRGFNIPPRPGSTTQPPPPHMGGALPPPPPGPYAPPPGTNTMAPPQGGSGFARPPSAQLGHPQQGSFVAGGQFASPPAPRDNYGPPPTNNFSSPNQPNGFAPPPPSQGRGFSVPPAGPQFIDSGAGAPPSMTGSSPYGPSSGQGGFTSPNAGGHNPYAPPPSQGFNAGPPPPGPGGMGGMPPPPGPSSSIRAPPPPPKRQEEKKAVELKYPSGDRSHIPERTREVYEIIEAELRKVPPPQHRELEKRLNLLFDGLNCETLTPATEDGLRAISQAISARDRPAALALHVEMLTRGDGDVAWMSGLKQLIVKL